MKRIISVICLAAVLLGLLAARCCWLNFSALKATSKKYPNTKDRISMKSIF